MNASKTTRSTPLLSWIRRSYVRSALIPLLCIELVLLGAYLASHTISERRTLQTFRAIVEEDFENLAGQKAAVLSERLAGVAVAVQVFRDQAQDVLTTSCLPDEQEVARYASSDAGVFHTAEQGGAALYYSTITQVGLPQRTKAYCSARLDPLMISLTEASPLIDQIYLNTFDSMNRIYPWFDVTEQYAADLYIPSFNFYYEADAEHNPQRGVQWTEAYLDPAGRGWMVSAVAPVYNEDFLEGVVGIDVTLATVISEVLQLDLPTGSYAMLLGNDRHVLALSRTAAEDWQIDVPDGLTDYGAVLGTTLQPNGLDLLSRPGVAPLAERLGGEPAGVAYFDLADGQRMAAWSAVEATGWTMLVVADEGEVYATVIALSETFYAFGWIMLAVLVVFSIGFFVFQHLRARRHSQMIAEPLLGLRAMVQRIGQGEFRQPPVTSNIDELTATGEDVARMGVALGEMTQRLVDADRELRRALVEAQAASRAKTEFLGKMSHELRTPLNAIIGFSDLIASQSLGPTAVDRYFDYAEDIRSSGQHLLGLINDVLDLSRIQAGERELSSAMLPVSAVFGEVKSAVEEDALKRGLAVRTDIEPALPALFADRLAARQILLNLVSNAMKFTSPGGTVTLGAAQDESGGHALWVADDGIGIPEHRLEDVLRPFEQVESAYARSYGGTGLGLTIVKDLVELHGGSIHIDSRLGQGTKVTVRFPPHQKLLGHRQPAAGSAQVA